MENNFSTRMESLTDDDLLDIIIDKRSHYQSDALAAADQEMYRRVLLNPALSQRMQDRRNTKANPYMLSAVEIWKTAKWGIMAFCVILFLYEILSKNYNSVAVVVLLNYFLAVWIVKRLIAKGRTFGHPFVFGLFVSAMILVVRFSLEMVFRAITQA